ncbi:hypothetical protein SO802_006762 [Lithocarpus litseifolius]|uniref:Uncharacterized protein n=1 Tax=Lithocarpus litseifolius TaxID=425828 RepID=A0AAW2DNI1_9ROSI
MNELTRTIKAPTVDVHCRLEVRNLVGDSKTGDFVLKDLKLQAEKPNITITSGHCARKFRRLSKAIHLHFLHFVLEDIEPPVILHLPLLAKDKVASFSDDYVQTPALVQNLASVQNPTLVQNPTPENRRARRGKIKLADIWAMTGEYKIQLPLNDEGQPIGKDGSLFVRWLGTFCENGMLYPLTPAGWPSERYIIEPNIVAPPNQMAWAMHQLGELRRNRRTKLKKDHVKSGLTRQQVLDSHLPTVIKAQCIEMADYWFNEKTVTLSDKNKVSWDKQEEISRFGAKNLAQISDEMVRTKLRIHEHLHEFFHILFSYLWMTELLNEPSIRLQGEIGRGILWSNDDAYARVMGRPERPGRVRGFASTPSSSRTTLRISELETSYEQLTEQVAQSEARHREELAQSEARHQQQMADVMTSVRDMINQISQGARDVSTQGGSA